MHVKTREGAQRVKSPIQHHATSNKQQQQHETNEYLKLDLLVVYLYCARTKPVAEKLWEHIKVIFFAEQKESAIVEKKEGREQTRRRW